MIKKAGEYWRGDERILGEGDFVAEALKQSEEGLKKKEGYKRAG